MLDKFHEECGVAAIYGHPEASKLAYLSLYALQHRGQESAGISTSDGKMIHTKKSMGHVADIFTERRAAGIPRRRSPSATPVIPPPAIRWNATRSRFRCTATKAGSRSPTTATSPTPSELRADLEARGAIFQASSDTEVILHLVAHSRERTLAGRAARSSAAARRGILAGLSRAGPHHCRPRSAGFPASRHGAARIQRQASPRYVFASETCAFDLINAVYMGDVQPGEMVIVGPEGVTRERYAPHRPLSQCVFEHVYFSRPDSIVFGRPVQESRETSGCCWPAKLRPMPISSCRCPIPATPPRSAIRPNPGLPYRQALIRNHYVGRTFIEPSQAIRDFGVKLKLNPVRSLLEGKSVILVDDSIVRGTTSRKIVRMVRQAGAREVHMRISCPPTVSPCFYGVDTPNKSELIAANNTIEEIRRFIEADSLGLPFHERAAAIGRGRARRILLRLLHRQLSHRLRQHRAARPGREKSRRVRVGQVVNLRPIGYRPPDSACARRAAVINRRAGYHPAPLVILFTHRRLYVRPIVA